MLKVDIVQFTNSTGQNLFGTLHQPENANRDLPVVVLLSPGVKMRVGPGRLYVPLTDMLCQHGYRVLRFDFHGLGDSGGELREKQLSDVYNHIEVGRYVDDTRCAMRWLRDACGAKKFVLGGLCGGAITALLAAQGEPDVIGLLSIGMTVTMASNAATPGKYMTGAQLDGRRRRYYRKLMSPRAWWRLLTLQSEYSVIWHSMKRMLVRKPVQPASVAPRPVSNAAVGAQPEPVEQRGNANPMFPPAYFAFLKRGGRAFMLFSGRDRLHSEYQEKFALVYSAQLAPFTAQIEQHVVPNANHVLSSVESRTEMLDHSRRWMLKHYSIPQVLH